MFELIGSDMTHSLERGCNGDTGSGTGSHPVLACQNGSCCIKIPMDRGIVSAKGDEKFSSVTSPARFMAWPLGSK